MIVGIVLESSLWRFLAGWLRGVVGINIKQVTGRAPGCRPLRFRPA